MQQSNTKNKFKQVGILLLWGETSQHLKLQTPKSFNLQKHFDTAWGLQGLTDSGSRELKGGCVLYPVHEEDFAKEQRESP